GDSRPRGRSLWTAPIWAAGRAGHAGAPSAACAPQGSPSAAVVSSSLYVFSASPGTDRVPPPSPRVVTRLRWFAPRGSGPVGALDAFPGVVHDPLTWRKLRVAARLLLGAGLLGAGLGLVGLVCGLLGSSVFLAQPFGFRAQDASAAAQGARQLGQPLRAEEQQRDYQQDEDFSGPDAHGCVSLSVRHCLRHRWYVLVWPPVRRVGGGWSRGPPRAAGPIASLPPRERRGVRSLTPGHPCTIAPRTPLQRAPRPQR